MKLILKIEIIYPQVYYRVGANKSNKGENFT